MLFGIEIDRGVQLVIYILLAYTIIGFAVRYHHKKTIQERVQSIGGELLSYKAQYSIFGAGPYSSTGRYSTIYYYVYSLDGNNKHGWVKFSIFSKPDWRS